MITSLRKKYIISNVVSSIKELHIGTGSVNIDEKFLDELKSVLESKIVPANRLPTSFINGP